MLNILPITRRDDLYLSVWKRLVEGAVLEVPVEEDCESRDLAHRLVRHGNVPVCELEDLSRHLLRPYNDKNVPFGLADLLDNVWEPQPISGQMHHFPPFIFPVSNRPPPRFSRRYGEGSPEPFSDFLDSSFNRLILPIRNDNAISSERTGREADMGSNPRITKESMPNPENYYSTHGRQRVSKA